MASTRALQAAKKELRSSMKKSLTTTTTEYVAAQSLAVCKLVQNSKPYQEARCVGIYLSMPTGEVQTSEIVRHALGEGKRVFVPYIHKPERPSPDTPKSVMDMLELRSLSDYDSLKRDSWGIPTIGEETAYERASILAKESATLDLILVPGVAFSIDPTTKLIRRLGHGKGFYDYFLYRYREGLISHVDGVLNIPGTSVLLYGLALEEQFLPPSDNGSSVPIGERDRLLHGLFVGNGKVIDGPVKQ